MKKKNEFYSEFGYYTKRIAALLDKRGEVLFRHNLGMGMRQFLFLRLLEANDVRPSQQLIANRLGIAKSAVSRHVDIARQRGWISVGVSATSRREHAITLTTEGKMLLAKAKTLIEQSEAQGFDGIPLADVKATIRTLKIIYGKLL